MGGLAGEKSGDGRRLLGRAVLGARLHRLLRLGRRPQQHRRRVCRAQQRVHPRLRSPLLWGDGIGRRLQVGRLCQGKTSRAARYVASFAHGADARRRRRCALRRFSWNKRGYRDRKLFQQRQLPLISAAVGSGSSGWDRRDGYNLLNADAYTGSVRWTLTTPRRPGAWRTQYWSAPGGSIYPKPVLVVSERHRLRTNSARASGRSRSPPRGAFSAEKEMKRPPTRSVLGRNWSSSPG